MNNTQKVLKNQHICEQATPNLGITQSSGLDIHGICKELSLTANEAVEIFLAA